MREHEAQVVRTQGGRTMATRRRAATRELARWHDDLAPLLASAPTPVPWDAVAASFDALLPLLPDPGWRAPTMRVFSLGGAVYVAVYKAMAAAGYDAAGAWALCEAATRSHFARMKGLARAAASRGMFSWVMRALTRSLDARSQRAPVGGWVARFVAGDAVPDYGVDYQRCAIHELAVAAGAADFAPFICNSDAIGSEVFGWGLTRTETLAQGGPRCDFRFSRGAPTRVRLHVLR